MDGMNRKAAQIGRYYRDAEISLGEALRAQGQLTEAKTILEKTAAEEDAIGSKDSSAPVRNRIRAHIALARVFFKMNQRDAARRNLDIATTLAAHSASSHPMDIVSQFDLSECYRAYCAAKVPGDFGARNLALWANWNRTRHPYPYSLAQEKDAARLAVTCAPSK